MNQKNYNAQKRILHIKLSTNHWKAVKFQTLFSATIIKKINIFNII